MYEETPDGWVLVQQSNVSGEVSSLETSSAEFLNQYQEGTTSIQLIGSKTLDNKAAAAGAFSFQLLEGSEVLQTVSNTDGGMIQFDAIQYRETGDHAYTVKEVVGSDGTIDYDRHTETVTVSVTEDGNHNLHADATYDSDGIRFANRTMPGTLEIQKIVDPSVLTDANRDTMFTFKVTLQNEDGTLVEGGNYYWYVVDEEGNVVTND